MLATYGYSLKDAPVQRAMEFIRSEQEPDGSWFGRWGVNYIYGTMLVLRGLEAIGVDHHEPLRAAGGGVAAHGAESRWRLGRDLRLLRRRQHQGSGAEHGFADGVGGDGIARGQRHAQRFVQRGIAYLLRTQRRDGSWDEPFYTGTGFPRVFYLMYYMYRQYFPLLALTTYAKAMAPADDYRLSIVRRRK